VAAPGLSGEVSLGAGLALARAGQNGESAGILFVNIVEKDWVVFAEEVETSPRRRRFVGLVSVHILYMDLVITLAEVDVFSSERKMVPLLRDGLMSAGYLEAERVCGRLMMCSCTWNLESDFVEFEKSFADLAKVVATSTCPEGRDEGILDDH
jgi:hypothetical protein